MPNWPSRGSRVSVRFHDTGGGQTDVIGYLAAVTPLIEVRTKSAGTVSIRPGEVVAVRELSHIPIRTSEIRSVEYAAALAWPGTEQHWHRGWLLRAGGGHTTRANSALPLDFSTSLADLEGIVSWYDERGLDPWLALPDRLLPVRTEGIKPSRVMVRNLHPVDDEVAASLSDRPDAAWLACYQRAVPVEVLTAVVDGEVTFASVGGVAVGRGAVTAAPDGTAWLGISAVRVADAQRRAGHGRAVCEALHAWGVSRGAQRAYVQVLDDNTAAKELYAALGYGLHHHLRYVDARRLLRTSL